MKSNTERPSAADPVPDAIQTLPDPTQKWKFISNLHPLSDLLGISRQVMVSSYVFGTGALATLVPWEGINYAMSNLAGVDFFGYLKELAKFTFLVYIPFCVISLIFMTVFNFT